MLYVDTEVKNVKIKAEFDPSPIRHLAIQCPNCNNWFVGNDILYKQVMYEYEIKGNSFNCPICGTYVLISDDSKIEEDVDFPKFYDNCKKKKTVWE